MTLPRSIPLGFMFAVLGANTLPTHAENSYAVVDTGQVRCYGTRQEITYPKPSESFYGQDAQYRGNQPSYRDNGDGTVTDLVTGLMWQQDPGTKRTFAEAEAGAAACRTGGYDDWRLPSIHELYSLILFSGEDLDPMSSDTSNLKPFIDTKFFHFAYGDPSQGERLIDSQAASSTRYVSTTMHGSETMFGVNFADGRIKGYPIGSERPGRPDKKYVVFYVRGNPNYGKNDFQDNGDGTITDRATGLMWMQGDSGHLRAGDSEDGRMNWEQALQWAEDLEYAGHTDWRLPNVKELQSIVDYTRSPDTTKSAAISPLFQATTIEDPLGEANFAFYWSSTTHKRLGSGDTAAYVAFGRSQGWMPGFRGQYSLLDVHGAGSQRSDPKTGDPAQFPRGRGPQGDVIAIYNMVRAVRGGNVTVRESGPELEPVARGRRGGGDPRMEPPGLGPGPMGPPMGPPLGPPGFGPGFRGRGQMGRPALGPGGRGRGERRPAPRGPVGGGFPPPEGPSPSLNRPTDSTGTEQGSTGETAKKIESAGPNFVFILADDMGWTGLSCSMDPDLPEAKSDYYQTPRIDRLARQGMRFSNAYAPSSMCTPTRASLLTGKSPALLHMTTPGPTNGQPSDRKLIPPRHIDSFPNAEITIAEVLRQRGYATAHLGKWHLAGGGPGEHGFDVHDGDTGNEGPGLYPDPNPKDIFGITERAVAFMEKQTASGRPFYVQLSHYAVHGPSRALMETKDEFANFPPGQRHFNIAYAAMTFDLDTSVGIVLDCVERLGIADNTYVVFMSDNGAVAPPMRSGENYPLSGGKATLFEGGVRVPLIIRGPGITPNHVFRENVVGYDLFPTFCELAKAPLPPPGAIEGISLVPALLHNDAQRLSSRDLVFHFPHYAKGAEQTPQSAILQGHDKLIWFLEEDRTRLFDLDRDLGEQHDLTSSSEGLSIALDRRLRDYLSDIGGQLPKPNPDYVPGEPGNSSSRKKGKRKSGGGARRTRRVGG